MFTLQVLLWVRSAFIIICCFVYGIDSLFVLFSFHRNKLLSASPLPRFFLIICICLCVCLCVCSTSLAVFRASDQIKLFVGSWNLGRSIFYIVLILRSIFVCFLNSFVSRSIFVCCFVVFNTYYVQEMPRRPYRYRTGSQRALVTFTPLEHKNASIRLYVCHTYTSAAHYHRYTFTSCIVLFSRLCLVVASCILVHYLTVCVCLSVA